MNRRPLLLGLTLILTLSGCDMIPFSGGKLEGEIKPLPEDWPLIRDANVIQIETNPAAPYSVKLWVVVMNNTPYIHAGANRATWVEHLEANPNLKLGYEGALYELKAVQVTDELEFNQLREIYKEKYGNYPRNSNLSEIYLYRLEPR